MATWAEYATKGHYCLLPVPIYSAFVIRGDLLSRGIDVNKFAAHLYAYDLFAQTFYTYRSLIIENECRDGATMDYGTLSLNNFPGATSILSMSGVRICPAVLPMMLIYVDPPRPSEFSSKDEIEHEELNTGWRRMRSRRLERACWLECDVDRSIYKALDYVIVSIGELVNVLYPRSLFNVNIPLLTSLFMSNHRRIDQRIREMSDSGRLVNDQDVLYSGD